MKTIMYCMVLALLLFCTNNLFSQEEENWVEIDSLDSYDEIEGLWAGDAVSIFKYIIDDTEYVSSLTITFICNYKKGNPTINHIVKFDFYDLVTDLEKFGKTGEIEYTKELIWQIFKDVMFKFNSNDILIGNYYFYDVSIQPTIEYFASDSEGKFYVNENRNLLYLIYSEPAFILGIGDSGFTEMIFKKIK